MTVGIKIDFDKIVEQAKYIAMKSSMKYSEVYDLLVQFEREVNG